MGSARLYLEPGSPSWPAALDEIDAPPAGLWLRGRVELLAREPRVAIVGSRAPSPYGEAQAERFGRELAAAGVAVVSGMALGIDQAAHRGALAAGGATIAVLGSGVDRPWPGGELPRRLVDEGLLLSEHPPGQAPRRHHFPLRNRLISGLSRAVLVVEAAARSGSLITARWAADQGREVLAVPGRIDHPLSRGCHRLLREGALLAESPAQLLEEVFGMASGSRRDEPRPEPLSGEAGAILAALRGETLSIEELCARTELSTEELLGRLIELELYGRVVRAPGGLYRLA